ncbi:MAG TPA: GAF domain-containing protein [Candidatus Limnocylindria bacterium]|nr:GAF domain-containing protein [Candidatus Limnocylindria bacterium]
MAPTGKKTAKKSTAKPRAAAAKKARPKSQEGVESLKRELADALEQQVATREILAFIADSPMDLQPVLDTVARRAAQLCDARDAQIFRVDGEVLRLAASHGAVHVRESAPIVRGSVTGRAVADREPGHVHDLASVADSEFPESKPFQRRFGDRSVLATPLLRRGLAVGAILIRRFELRPFTDRQIKLLEIFAAQAVVAIENVRLFNELKESLDQQTATSEILGVIASSPTDIQPVLDVVAENAARLCEATDAQIRLVEGDGHRRVASFGPIPAPEFVRTTSGHPAGRAILTGKTTHVIDLVEAVKSEFPDYAVPE